MNESNIYDTEEFRDSIATVGADGKRVWMYPKKPSGRFTNARTYVSWIYLLIFFTLPFIKVGGEPFFLLNVLQRRFVLFGVLFTPQDFHLFVLAMLTFIVFIILFTVVFGRLFCGWACPQTVFMEMVFRKIEYWIEGDAGEQRKLNNSPWTTHKIQKKTIKHLVFFAISVIVANWFLAYIIGMDEVKKIVFEPIDQHFGGFMAMLVFSGLFYGVFAFLREQVCIAICPYGRLQGVLLVKETIVVAYDYIRGEPRGKIKKQKKTGDPAFPLNVLTAEQVAAEKTQGDCVDCKLCIHVCPTGIDIRNGTQLECVNCTACIDACDDIMDKVGRPRGLIRYDSMTGIEQRVQKIFTPRVYAYSAVLAALLILDGFLFSQRTTMEAIILRAPGMLYQEVDSLHISNLYKYDLINKTAKDFPVRMEIEGQVGKIRPVGQGPSLIPAEKSVSGAFFIDMEKSKLHGRKNPITIQIFSGDKVVDEVETNFMGPGGK